MKNVVIECVIVKYFVHFLVFEVGGVMAVSNEPFYSHNHDAAILTCTSFGGPVNSFQWFKNDDPFTELETGLNDMNVLTLYGVNASVDGGVYTCVVNNSAGSSNASVSLNISPVFVQLPQDVNTRTGVRVQMICEAAGYPEPVYHWEKMNGDLPLNTSGSNTSTLTFLSVNYEDEGSYSCVAANIGESILASAFLKGECVIIVIMSVPMGTWFT